MTGSQPLFPLVLFAAFGSPLMLWGLAGASLPILIHLLNRRKFREMRWAAMRFLLAAIRKNQRRVSIEQWILLAVRTLLLIFLALAMAKPALESLGLLGGLGGRRHWVLALDGSMSMDYRTGGESRFDQARQIARRLVKDARNGDGFSLVLLSDPERTVIGAPAHGKDAVIKAIDELRLPHGDLDLGGGFQAIDRVVESSDIGLKELVVLTDLQRASWNAQGGSADDQVRRALARLEGKRVRSLLIDLGAPNEPNRAVSELSIRPAVVTTGVPVTVRAKMRAFGADFTAGIARLVVDGRTIPTEERQIPPLSKGATEELEFSHIFNSPGDHVIEVRLSDDPLVLDNRRRAVVSVREAIMVLVVDGDPKPGLFQSETAFLAEALAPEPDSPGQTSPIRLQIMNETQFGRADLSNFDAVVLANVPRVTRAQVDALEAFLRLGGGLLIYTGDQVQTDVYNRLLFDDGRGLMPARLGAAIGDALSRESPFPFDTLGFRHPILADYAGQSDPVQSSLTLVKTHRYHRLTIPRDSPAQSALRLGNDPLVVENGRGKGRVFLVATTADRDWTDWPIHKSYPVVMQAMLFEAAAGRFSDRTVSVGQPFEELLPASAAGSEAAMTWPDRDEGARESDIQRSTIKIEPAGAVSVLRSPPTEFSGTYRVELGPPLARTERFAANPDPAESDLDKLDQPGVKASLPGWQFDYAADWQPLKESAASVGQRGELHRGFLWAVLAFLIIESILAWKFGHHAAVRR